MVFFVTVSFFFENFVPFSIFFVHCTAHCTPHNVYCKLYTLHINCHIASKGQISMVFGCWGQRPAIVLTTFWCDKYYWKKILSCTSRHSIFLLLRLFVRLSICCLCMLVFWSLGLLVSWSPGMFVC